MQSSRAEPARRAAAIAALLGGATEIAMAVLAFGSDLPRGLVTPLCFAAAAGLAWVGLLRRGPLRLAAQVGAALLLGIAIGEMVAGNRVWQLVVVLIAGAISVACARRAFSARHALPAAPAPAHPVLFVNPRSGDGRAGDVGLVGEARRRGYETVELSPGDDLERLARDAVERGADGLAMAGGDGSQAVVASIAAEQDLPYACIPSGTRNHFALDLGVDRDDVVGALDAFRDGGERLVDLAEVNGRVFVNNASLGVYAEAVSRRGYRESKLRTIMETIPETLGPNGEAIELRWRDPDGAQRISEALVLVSNNIYRTGAAIGAGSRPRLDEAVLGVIEARPPAAAASGALWRRLKTDSLEIDADRAVPIGIDGEATELEPPLRFRIRPGALRVRVSAAHPGASPAAQSPAGPLAALGELAGLALGTRP